MITRPDHSEAPEYYFTYIDQALGDDVRVVLEAEEQKTIAALRALGEARSLHRYAPGKWSIREVVSHINDCERLFTYRAFWFARGLEGALPSFDQDAAVVGAKADDRTFAAHITEFAALRASTRSLFANLPDEAWSREGIASGNRFTVRALAWITSGHAIHHMRLLQERYQ
ncbi:MAG: DinB family protein [bacterium]